MKTMSYTESRARYAEVLDSVTDDREEVVWASARAPSRRRRRSSGTPGRTQPGRTPTLGRSTPTPTRRSARHAAAMNPDASAQVLDRFADDPFWSTRIAVAEHPTTASPRLLRLLQR